MNRHRAILVGLCLATSSPLPAQVPTSAPAAAIAPVPAWQTAAGTAMSFEVASIREDKGEFTPPSFALSADDWFRDPAGRFHADFELLTYITFAYKLWLSPAEETTVLAKQPDWVKSTRFAIQAVAPAHATKDQYRLMMQALLADRFGLRLHFEQSDRPVLAMLLVTPGRPGPRLKPHSQGQPCDETPRPTTFPGECYSYAAEPLDNGEWKNGSRATTMDLLANFVASEAGSSGEIGRRVVNQTGLTGLWDFTLDASPPSPAPAAQAPQPSTPPGPTMLEALRDQLGIRLKPARALVSLPVIDHIQRPTEN